MKMKKILLFATALAALFLSASCQRENLEPVAAGATFTVTVPGETATKAFSDGTNINKVLYEIYKTDEVETAQPLAKGAVSMSNKEATVTFDLLQDQEYTVIFWAQKSANEDGTNNYYNTGDLRTVSINTATALNANDEDRAAFFKRVDFATPMAEVKEVELVRPFAQLNLGTTAASLNPVQPGQTQGYTINVEKSYVKVEGLSTTFNTLTGVAAEEDNDFEFALYETPYAQDNTEVLEVNGVKYHYVGMNYFFVSKNEDLVTVSYKIKTDKGEITNENIINVPVKANYRTNIIGNLLTTEADFEIVVDEDFADEDLDGGKYGIIDGKKYIKVETSEEFNASFADNTVDIIILSEDIVLSQVITRSSADPVLTISSGKTLLIDLNGKKLSSTSSQTGKNYNMFDVRGTLTVKNGTLEYEHEGENMEWNNSTNLFNVTAGGVLNLEGVTARNLGGSDMGFVAHLNNWGEVTLNVENCVLESNYVAVRVFNSGPDMNNVTIKNSTLKGGNYAFWVHNYTADDFGGSESKAEAQKALLNLNIYDQGNTFSPDVNGIRYGFTNSVKSDANGITKTVSEDGSVVTLGSMVEDGIVRRYVAGTEENTTITKVVVGEGVTTLYDRTFRRYYALETVELPSTLTTIGEAGTGVFQSCGELKNITLPDALTTLGVGTFYGCRKLESINIPAGITRVEADAFRETGLKSVEFHAGVTYFGTQAFRDCEDIEEIYINAPSFTIESNTFLNAAAPYPSMTIYVVNPEMKEYLESVFDNHTKTFITVVGPSTTASADDLVEALENGENVYFTDDIKIEPAGMSNAYGTTGINVKDGQTIDGNGHILDIKGAGGTWDSGISTTGGLIKNITITGSFRGIFVNHNSSHSEPVILENVIIDGTTYTISCDQGNYQNLEAYNSTFNGWTSYAATLGEVSFDTCSFGKGNGYAYCRPYAPTVFKNCAFEAGYTVDPRAAVVFENCTVGGVALTSENIASLVTGTDKVTLR